MIEMIYAQILAGGQGSRMGNTEVPKQFLKLGQKPTIIHTIEKFLFNNEIDKILVSVPEFWINSTRDFIEKYILEKAKIEVIAGGSTRNETIMTGIKYIDEYYGIQDDDIIITHDAVRPFVSYRIIDENIKYAKEYGATDTVIPAVDTIVMSQDHEFIKQIPMRSDMYQGQTPQSFNIKLLVEAYKELLIEEKASLTDAAKIMILQGKPVKLVEGEYYNIKITTQYDLLLANAILQGIKKND